MDVQTCHPRSGLALLQDCDLSPDQTAFILEGLNAAMAKLEALHLQCRESQW